MRERGRLAMIARLIEVQRARRGGAEAALSEARTAEADARAAEDSARQAVDDACADWIGFVEKPGFAPEQSVFLSQAVIDSDLEAHKARLRTESAGLLSERRQRDWQLLEAQVRAGTETHRTLRRKAVRRTEEKRIEALADRITFNWRRP